MAVGDGTAPEVAVLSPIARIADILRGRASSAGKPAERTMHDLFVVRRFARRPALADQNARDVRFPLETALALCPTRHLTRSSPSKATAWTKFRSAPCMQVSSSPDISDLQQAAKPWSGWNSGWGTRTKVSRGSCRELTSIAARGLRGGYRAIAPSPLLTPFQGPQKRHWKLPHPIAPSGFARCLCGTRTACQSSRRYRRDLQRCFVRPDACALQRVARKRFARRRHRVRSSFDAGPHRARRCDSRCQR